MDHGSDKIFNHSDKPMRAPSVREEPPTEATSSSNLMNQTATVDENLSSASEMLYLVSEDHDALRNKDASNDEAKLLAKVGVESSEHMKGLVKASKKADQAQKDCLNLARKACFRKIPPSSFHLFLRPQNERVDLSSSGASGFVSAKSDVSKIAAPVFQKSILFERDLEPDRELTHGRSLKVVEFESGNKIESQNSNVSSLASEGNQQGGPTTPDAENLGAVRCKKQKKTPPATTGKFITLSQDTLGVVPLGITAAGKGNTTGQRNLPSTRKFRIDMDDGDSNNKTRKEKKKNVSKGKHYQKSKNGEMKRKATSNKLNEFSMEVAEKNETWELQQQGDEHKQPIRYLEKISDVIGQDGETEPNNAETPFGDLAAWNNVARDLATGNSPLNGPSLVEQCPSQDLSAATLSSSSTDLVATNSRSGAIRGREESSKTRELSAEMQRTSAIEQTPQVSTIQSFMMGSFFGVDRTKGSFMIGSHLDLTDFRNQSTTSPGCRTLVQPCDVLKEVSSSTIQLLKTYKALVEDSGNERWAPIKDLMNVMSYDELTRKRHSVIETQSKRRNDSIFVKEESIVGSMLEDQDDHSSLLLGSTVTESSLSMNEKQSEPNNVSELDQIEYFGSQWDSSPSKLDESNTKMQTKETLKTVSEAIDHIDNDKHYDAIFTYKIPATSPFDMNDSLADVQFKCMQTWMNDNIDTLYRACFTDQLKTEREEKEVDQILKKITSLQLKIRAYEDLKQVKPVGSYHSDSSRSTFSLDGSKAGEYEMMEGNPEEWTDCQTSDERIDSEIGMLNDKLEEILRGFGDEEKKSQSDYGNIDVTERRAETSGSFHFIASGSECSQQTRRKQFGDQLELLVKELEEQVNRLKNENNTERSSSKQAFNQSRLEPDCTTDQLNPISNERFLQDVEAKWKKDFLFNTKTKIKKSQRNSAKVSREQSIKNPPTFAEKMTDRQRLQLYLNGLVDTWQPSDEEDSALMRNDGWTDNRGVHLLKKEEVVAETRRVKHQKKRTRYLLNDKSRVAMDAIDRTNKFVKSRQTSGSVRVKTESDQSKHTKRRFTQADFANIPFTCNCLCDRVSRFNVKQKEHFRKVLNENLLCLRSNSGLEEGNQAWKQRTEREAGLCISEHENDPKNFSGWLADTDRNLLLLFNRSLSERVEKEFNVNLQKDKPTPSPEPENETPKLVFKSRIEETLKKISKQEANQFWFKVDEWYTDYKKCDKTWQLIDELQNIDINATMKRDLKAMQEDMNEKLRADKAKVKYQLELIHRNKFFENLKKLRGEYECRIRNHVAAKQREMESKKEFMVQSTLREMKEKYRPIQKEHKHRCLEWIAGFQDRTSQIMNQRRARELALIVEKVDAAERTRRQLVGATGKEHEEIEKALRKATVERGVVIAKLNQKVQNLKRDVNIWKRAVREVLNSFKKFMHYVLETRPSRDQYFRSLEKLYQIQMDDILRETTEELKRVETSEARMPENEDILQPTMEIKCPSHDIRYSPQRTTEAGSSSDTDIDLDARKAKIAGYVVDAAIRSVMPSPEISEEEDDYQRLKAFGGLISDFFNTESEVKRATIKTEEECLEESATLRGPVVEDSDSDITEEEFTRRRIRDMLNIITRRKPQIEGLVHL